jgi:hypothetical protein
MTKDITVDLSSIREEFKRIATMAEEKGLVVSFAASEPAHTPGSNKKSAAGFMAKSLDDAVLLLVSSMRTASDAIQNNMRNNNDDEPRIVRAILDAAIEALAKATGVGEEMDISAREVGNLNKTIN